MKAAGERDFENEGLEGNHSQTEIGHTETEKSSEPEVYEEQPARKSQRTLLAEWLTSRDYPNHKLSFLPNYEQNPR